MRCVTDADGFYNGFLRVHRLRAGFFIDRCMTSA